MQRKALIVEPDKDLADAYTYLLEELGFEVEGVPGIGVPTTDHFNQFDLLVVELEADQQVEILARVAKNIEVPILISSTDTNILLQCKTRNLGAAYLQKPFNIRMFDRKVKEVVALYYPQI